MKRFGLIGYPLKHSYSADWFSRRGVDYRLFELERIEDFPALLVAEPDLVGLNVTIPYKEAILPYLNSLSPESEAIGAVNCIVCLAGKWIGHNTDAPAFRHALETFLPSSYHLSALILGRGGASRAVQYALRQLKIPFEVVNRVQVSQEMIEHNNLIINATPIGMFPHTEEAPDLPYQALTPEHYLFDLIYNPAETEFLRRGRQQGAHTQNGLSMFEKQAQLSHEKFISL